MKKAAFTNSFVSSAAKASAIFGVDYQRGKSGTPQKRMERRWLNETAQKRAAAAGAESAVYAVASDEDGRNEVREYFGMNYLRHCAEEEILRYVAGRDVVGITLNDFNSLHCAPDSLLGLCGFSVRMDWKFTRGYQNRSQSAVKDEVLAKCKKNGLLFYIYVYSVLKISCKRDGDAPAVEAVRAADALMRHPMTPEMLEQRIAGLRASVRYDRTSVSKKRVISDLQITVAEQKQLKRLLGHEEDLRRKSKSGMLRSERDTALDTAIVEMLAQGKLHREIGEKLGMARESVTRRIRRNNLLREVQEARNALAKEQARAKKAEKTKNKDDDDKNGGARAGGTQAASKPQKKSSRKPLSESRWLAVLAVQRVRRAKERLARKCSICIRNLAKRYYRLNAARVEWISGVSAAKSLCATPFPQLC